MASSFVKYQNNGFWIRDSILEVTCAYMCLIIKKQHFSEPWVNEWAERLQYNSWGYFRGFMSLEFDDFIITRERQEVAIDIVNKTIKYLSDKSENLNLKEDLDEVLDEETRRLYSSPVLVERSMVISVLTYLVRLLLGEQIEDNSILP